MSEFDEIDFDETLNDEDSLEPEDIFKMVTINKVRKKRTYIEIEDPDGSKIELKDIIIELLDYLKDKLSDNDSNQMTEQILPLMAQSVASGLSRIVGIKQTAFYLAQPEMRMAIIHMMTLSLYLLKFIQKEDLTINTYEEDVSDEEIAELERKTNISSTVTLATLAGEDPMQILKALRDQGKISEDDLRDILGDNDDDFTN